MEPRICWKIIDVRNKPPKIFRFQKLESHNELIEFSRVSPLSKLFSCKNTIVNKILISESQSDKSAKITNDSRCIQHGNHYLDYSKPIRITYIECQACKTFYSKFVKLSEDKIDEVCYKTKEQNSD